MAPSLSPPSCATVYGPGGAADRGDGKSSSAETAGLYYATGHMGMGITSAPATAEALSGLILRGRSPLPIEAFAPSRFAAAGVG